ncbi:hypothetical protein [Photorhabdus bodei]|uniref:Uncharacterized protein n=1 Tax=Photorhabdus bodei TaxID=2029681 RepID=A0AAW6BCL4_9GAMM|nr:hypothetical protein [Photorhabdus bodei]MDB6370708.1 hypothetical protein [Photorhabdus bodei]
MTGVSECSQQRGNLKDDGYISICRGSMYQGYDNALLSSFVLLYLYPMDFKMHLGGKGANPREHRELCDRGERVQPTKKQLER